MKLEGKVAIITGCAHGIGEATAKLFAREGAKVCGCDVADEEGQATINGIVAAGGEAAYCHGDVSADADCKSVTDCAVENFGGLDILINNAAIANFIKITDMSEEEWDRLININLKSCYLMSRHAIPRIKDRGGGAIVNIASVHGMATQGNCTAYAASKAGVIGFTRSLALELAPEGIRVNCVLPGAIQTAMFMYDMERNAREKGTTVEQEVENAARMEPIGRVGQPIEIAKALLFLASDDSSFATGYPFAVDGGLLASLW